MNRTSAITPILVKTSVNGKSRTEIWHTSEPFGIGHPYQWVLQRTENGILAMNIGTSPGTVRSNAAVWARSEELARGAELELRSKSRTINVRLTPIQSVKPAYLADPTLLKSLQKANETGTTAPAIFAYSGVRRSMLNGQRVHSAFVGYCRQEPVFTAYLDKAGLKIKPLLNGVFIKYKGNQPWNAPIGSVHVIPSDQVASVTLSRGWYWWRFNTVDDALLSGLFASTLNKYKNTRGDDRWFRRLLSFAVSAVVVLGAATFLLPNSADKLQASRTDAPIVKFKARPRSLPPVKTAKLEVAPRGEIKKALARAGQSGNASKAAMLRNALSGALAMIQKTSGTRTAGMAKSANEFFGSKTVSMAPTEIQPGFVPGSVKVGGLGGGSGNGKGIGYGTGDRGTIAGQGNSFVAIDGAESVVEEGLTRDEVGQVIHAHMGEVRYCYDAAMVRSHKIEGKLVSSFTILATGAIKSASLVSSTLNDPQLGNCILARLKTWQFPKPKGGVTVTVSYPFVFKTLSRDE